jgi:hypothetical protein
VGIYLQGNAVTVSAAFALEDGTPADPSTVEFRVRLPDGTLHEYHYPSAQVARTGTGEYDLLLSPALLPLPGEYHYDAVGTGDVQAVLSAEFVVAPSSVVPPDPISGPQQGPCQAWISGEDVAACCGADPGSSSLFDGVAYEASMALYAISGRQYTGLCERTVRPCRSGCSCWGERALGLTPWSWAAGAWGYAGVPGAWGFSWWNENGDSCGCGSLSRVKLAGYPVREIVEVLIDGDVLDPVDEQGNPNYRLDGWRWLTRMDAPGPPVLPRRWPSCQNMALDSDQAGTFEVTYLSGIDPPPIGRTAAAELACQLFLACGGGAGCQLPAGVTRVVRQGVEIDRNLLQNWFDRSKSTGLVALDLFLASYWNARGGRRPAVWSPDVQQFAKRLGSD